MSVLLAILIVVVLYAIGDVRRRGARNDWQRTLNVALVLVHVEGTARVDDAAVAALRARVPELEARRGAESRRHRGGGAPPFSFMVYGVSDAPAPAPVPRGAGWRELLEHAWEQRRWLGAVDDRTPNFDPGAWDARVYVSVRKPANRWRSAVEGRSEQGGRIGFVEVELGAEMADFTLFVATHELLHTLGATDKYDALGRTLVPDGLAAPDLVPRYPQRHAEIMARNRPLSATNEVVPESLSELAVGAATAREIGWLK